MSDIRSMLRSERATRRITHPQAQYTSAGALLCKACRVQLRSDAHWQAHISNPQHIRVLKSLASGLMSQNSALGSKRKADSEEEEHAQTSRKRNKPAEQDFVATAKSETISQPRPDLDSSRPSTPTDSTSLDLDREYAAFERAIADTRPSAVHEHHDQKFAAATITAAPVTATELAAKSNDGPSVDSRALRDAEIEGEKEDAQRRLEEEFDEMEELEARVNRLKERRETLRPKLTAGDARRTVGSSTQLKTEQGPEDDGSEDDDWDDWGS